MELHSSALPIVEPMHPMVPGTPVMPQFAARTREMRLHQAQPEPEPSLEDLLASSLVEPRAMLPSKLIEFPRELISPRRARPHLPEDPTRTKRRRSRKSSLRSFASLRSSRSRSSAGNRNRACRSRKPSAEQS